MKYLLFLLLLFVVTGCYKLTITLEYKQSVAYNSFVFGDTGRTFEAFRAFITVKKLFWSVVDSTLSHKDTSFSGPKIRFTPGGQYICSGTIADLMHIPNSGVMLSDSANSMGEVFINSFQSPFQPLSFSRLSHPDLNPPEVLQFWSMYYDDNNSTSTYTTLWLKPI